MTDSNGTQMYMPVAPAYGAGGGDMFGGGFGGGWWVIFFLIIMMGGWGNGFGGFGGNGMFPWMMAGQNNTNNDVTRGFDQAALVNGITGVQNAVTSGFGDMQTALCSGFGNVQNALCGGFGTVNSNIANGFAQAEIAANARQIADLQQTFGVQTAITGVGTGTQAGLADVKYALATEGANTRAANTANTQAILDKLRLEQRVTEAVDGMSVSTFHQTLNEFMSENLCAVQVLGFVLGAMVGALQLLTRI